MLPGYNKKIKLNHGSLEIIFLTFQLKFLGRCQGWTSQMLPGPPWQLQGCKKKRGGARKILHPTLTSIYDCVPRISLPTHKTANCVFSGLLLERSSWSRDFVFRSLQPFFYYFTMVEAMLVYIQNHGTYFTDLEQVLDENYVRSTPVLVLFVQSYDARLIWDEKKIHGYAFKSLSTLSLLRNIRKFRQQTFQLYSVPRQYWQLAGLNFQASIKRIL